MKSWIEAMRLRTLPLSIAGIITGGAMAYNYDAKNFHLHVFIHAIITALLLQILSNFANDYGDFENGADNENRLGPKRAVHSGEITAKEMKYAIIIMSIITLISGVVLLYLAFQDFDMRFIVYFLIGIACIAAAIKYTMGKNPYGYKGLGDIFVFLFFGIVSAVGTFFLLTKTVNILIFLPAISIGAWSTAVLNLNNMRDIESDKASGKITIPVRLGKQKALTYHFILILSPFICNAFYAMSEGNMVLLAITGVAIIPALFIFRPLIKNPNHEVLDGLLKKTALFALFFTVLFVAGIIFKYNLH